jgi:hypothetical protein
LKLLNSHSEELTDDQQRVSEEVDNDSEERDNVQMQEFSLKESGDIFRAVKFLKQKIMDACPNFDRSMQIRKDVHKTLCAYQHVCEGLKKEKTIQSALPKRFERQ